MFRQVKSLLNRSQLEPSLVGISNLVAGILGGVFWLILATIVPVSDYGYLNYNISLLTILSAVSMLGLNTTIMTFLPKGEEKLRQQANLLVLVANVLIVLPLLAITQNFSLALMLVGTSFFTMTISEVLGRKKYTKFPALVIGERVAQFGLSIGLYFIFGVNGILLGYGISLIAFSYSYFKNLVGDRTKPKLDNGVPTLALQRTNATNTRLSLDAIRPKSKFIAHAFSTSIAQSLTTYADKLIIGPLFGFGVLGLYQLGFQFLVFLAVIPVSLTQYLLPQEASGVERKGVRKVGILLASSLGILFYFSLETVITWLFPAYVEAIPAAQLMILGIIPMTFTAIMNAKLFGTGRSKIVLLGSMIYLSSLFTLLYLLGNAYPLLGLAIALVTALSLQTIALFAMTRIVVKK